jgi:hypothetical protein
MLVHTSPRKGEHGSVRETLLRLWNECAFNAPSGRAYLEELWSRDHRAVSEAQGGDLQPEAFEQLVPFLAGSLAKIERPLPFVVVNSDSSDAPDFSAAPVWKIVIGGNKLSRGYTVEGLTVSYYRRAAKVADTLMQMGRWFGFRLGYKDLVRVYLGVKEGKDETDLVASFKEACRMEERFREEVKRYVRKGGERRLTPRDVPPLITMSGALPPTARNKMFNARLLMKNFGGQWSMVTVLPREDAAMKSNLRTFSDLVLSAEGVPHRTLSGVDGAGKAIKFDCRCLAASTDDVVEFLKGVRWLESDFGESGRPSDVELQIEFLRSAKHGIESWLLIAPQRSASFGRPVVIGDTDFTVKKRSRVGGRSFGVIGEPVHRVVAEYLCGLGKAPSGLRKVSEETLSLRDPRRGVMLCYPVRESEKSTVSIGFEILYPSNDLSYEILCGVHRAGSHVVVRSAGER